ncbi:MAG: Ig-like domain-containing protein [Dongiaceae bacterium]
MAACSTVTSATIGSISGDTGSSASDFVTADNTLAFAGSITGLSGIGSGVLGLWISGGSFGAANGGKGTLIGTTSVSAPGAWTIPAGAAALPDGSYTLHVTAGTAGSAADLAARTLVIDTTAPTNVPGQPDIQPASDSGRFFNDHITQVTTPTLEGSSATPGAQLVLLDSDGTTVLGTATADASGKWSATTSTLSEGVHSITAREVDAAGNRGPASGALVLTIDLTAPSAPSLPAIDPASDTGVSSTDGFTSDTTPTFTGSGAEPGAPVSLLDTDGTVVGRQRADSDGNWTITANPLASGFHRISAMQTDLAGNPGPASGSILVKIDTSARALLAPDLADASDTGNSQTDNLTTDNTPTFQGSAATGTEPYASLVLYDGTTVIGTGTADSAGGWSLTSTVLADGAHSIAVQQTDLAGNSTLSPGLAVVVDTAAPPKLALPDLVTDTGDNTTDNVTRIAAPTFSGGGAVAGAKVSLYDTDGTTLLGTATVDTAGNWSITSTSLADGRHTVTVRQGDAAGNQSPASPGLAVTVDTVVATPGMPDLAAVADTGRSNADNVTANNQPLFTGGGAEPGALVILWDGDLAVTNGHADAAGNYALTPLVQGADGLHQFSVSQYDAAGNTSARSPALQVKIDTTPPAPLANAPDLVAASDSGASGTDNVTSDTTPTFNGGGAEASATVILYDGGVARGSTIADGVGNWSVTAATLGDGVHQIAVRQVDLAGNAAALTSPALSVTIDATAPAAPGAPDLQAGSDTGRSSTDDVTSDTTPTLQGGGAVAGAVVTLYDSDGTTALGSAAADGSGSWTITSTALANGLHTLTARQVDAAGNQSPASPGLAVAIDTAVAAPSTPDLAAGSDSGSSSTDNLTSKRTITVTGTGEPGAKVTIYDQDPDTGGGTSQGSVVVPGRSAVPSGTAIVDASGQWSVQVTMPTDGRHTLYATQTDAAGNSSGQSGNLLVVLDTVAPAAIGAPDLAAASDTGSSSIDNLTGTTTPTFTGSAPVGAAVRLYDTNGTTVLGTTTADFTGSWTITSSALSAGTHSITARQVDAAGNASAASPALAVTIDVTAAAPGAPDLQPGSDSGSSSTDNLTNDNTPTVSGGGAEAGAAVRLYDTNGTTLLGSATADASGGWTITSTALGNGLHSLTARQTDAAGNVSAASPALAVTIDRSAAVPGAPDLAASSDRGSSSTDNVTSVATPTFSGGGAESGATVRLYDGATLLGSATASAAGAWTITSASLADGTHTVTARQTDLAGNVSGVSPGLAVTVDTAAPGAPSIETVTDGVGSLTGPVAAGGSTDDPTPAVRIALAGTGAAAGDSLELLDGGAALGAAVTLTAADIAAGHVEITPAALANGLHSLSARLTDVAGNRGSAGPSFALTVGALAPVVITGLAEDSGAAGDHVTSDGTPTLSGTAEPGTTVTLFRDGDAVGTAAVDAAGQWSFTTDGLGDGAYRFTAQSTDGFGNQTEPSAAFAVTVDTVAPAAPTIDAVTPDSGAAGDGLTGDGSPLLSGTAEAGSIVTLFRDGSPIGTTTADAAGQWSLETGALGDGSYLFTAQAADAAGNARDPSDGFALTIDATAPAQPTIEGFADDSGAAGDHLTNDATPQLSGHAESGAGVALLVDGALVATTTADAEGQWSLATGALQDGSHTLVAIAADAAGNTGPASEPFVLQVDTAAPAAPTIDSFAGDSGAPGDQATSDQTLLLSGTAEPGATVEILQDGAGIGTALADGDGAWSFATGTLGDGTWQFTAVARDDAGNASLSSTALAVTVDTAAPEAPVIAAIAADSGVPGDHLTSDPSPTVSGQAEAGAVVELRRDGSPVGTVVADGSGAWSLAMGALGDGTWQLTAVATDAAGNASDESAPFAVTIDGTAPARPTIDGFAADSGAAGDHLTNDPTPTLSGGAEAGSTIELFQDGQPVGTAAVDGSGHWSLTTALLGEGAHQFAVVASDAAGNAGAASDPFLIEIDGTAPPAPTLDGFADDSGAAGDLVTRDATLVLSGSAAAGSTVEVLQDGSPIGTATADGAGAWSLATASLADGTHAFAAVAIDAAGNASGASAALEVTVDTAAPAIPGIDRLADDVGGAGGHLTSSHDPVLSGTAEAGSVVALFRDGEPVGTATADGAGQWSLAVAGLGDGTWQFTAAASDAAGNASLPSAAFQVTVDGTPPAAPAIDGFADDTGAAGDHLTADATPTLGGSAEAGSIVTLLDGSTVLGTVVADAAGRWSLTTAALADGDHALTAIAADAAGNRSGASAPLAVTIDGTAPAAPAIDGFADDTGVAGDGITASTVLVLSGSAEAASTVALRDGGTLLGTAAADAAGRWSFVATGLAEGVHGFTATALDAAGNASGASAALAVVVDSVAPAAPTVAAFADDTGIAGDGLTGDSTLVLSGAAEAGSTVSVLDHGTLLGTALADAGGAWSFATGTLADGDHGFAARATDAAGNQGGASATLTVTVDTTMGPPSIDRFGGDSGIPGDHITNDTTPTLSGTAKAGSTVTVYAGSLALGTAAADAGGAWSLTTAALADGPWQLAAIARDGAGNESGASAAFALVIDTHAPTAAVTGISSDTGLAGDGITSDRTLVVSGIAEAGSTVQLFRGGMAVGSATADAGGAWSVDTSGTSLANGAYQFTAAATDAAGNAGPLSAALAVTVDGTAPGRPVILGFTPDTGKLLDGITKASQITLVGTAEAGSTLAVYDGATLLGTTTAGAGGSWSFATASLADGTHRLTATATDKAGNAGLASTALSATIDTAAPALAMTGDLRNANGSATLSGTGEAGSIVTVYDGGTALGTVKVAGNGSWSFTTRPLSGTPHMLDAAAIDAAGNVRSPAGVAWLGGAAKDTLPGTAGDDLFTGGGNSDTFAFAPHFGRDVVTDFAASGPQHDVLQIDHGIFANYATLMANAAQVGADVVITAGSDSITLKNVAKANLGAADFHFV